MPPSILSQLEKRSTLLYGTAALGICLLIAFGVFAKNGWFGKPVSVPLPAVAGGLTQPNAPLPAGTPQLAREYLWAGNRLLAVEDANANAAPPADLAIWRPSDGVWWVMGGPGSQQVAHQWGVPCNPPTPPTDCDRPAPGDFDGDGKTDFSVFRPSTGVWWIVRSSDSTYASVSFGVGTDKLAPADFDGDGKTDMAVFRQNDPSAGLASWYIRRSSDETWGGFPFGSPSDVPAPADYDGDGRADVGVWRSSDQTFYSINSSNNQYQTQPMGTAAATVPVSADYDGDGKADYAVRNGPTWHIRKSTTGTIDVITPNGDLATDQPVPNDYDGDGRVDIAVWRDSNGNWYIRKSTGGTREEHWGQSGDIPVPAFYRR